VVDLDPQGNATMGSGIDKRTLDPSVYDVLLESASIVEARRPSPKGGYDVVGANRELAGAEVELVGVERRDRRLRSALAAVDEAYDFVLIDCPPSLSLLTLNGLACAHGVVVPMQCEYFALEGLSDLVNTIKQVHANINPQLEVIGILRVMFDAANHVAGAGERAAQGALRRSRLRHRDPAQRPPGRGAELRHAGPGVRPGLQGRARLPRLSPGRWRRGPTRAASRHEPAGRPPKGEYRSAQHEGTPVRPAFAPGLLSRVEDAGINASAPREQLWVDGWLVRFSPGKAKRARCVQAGRRRSAAARRAARALCRDLRRPSACSLISGSRLFPAGPGSTSSWRRAAWRGSTTPGSWSRRSTPTRPLPSSKRDGNPGIDVVRAVDGDAFAEWIGLQRGSSAEAASPMPSGFRHSPVRHRALCVLDSGGRPMAGGQVVVEGELAGLYDIFSVEAMRGRGWRRPMPASCSGSPRPTGRAWPICRSRRAMPRRGGSTNGSASPTPTPITTARRRPLEAAAQASEAGAFVDAEVNVHALDRGAARALAQVVEPGHQQHLALVAEDEQLGAVAVVAGLDVEVVVGQHRRVAKRHDAHEALSRIALGQGGVQMFGGRAAAGSARGSGTVTDSPFRKLPTIGMKIGRVSSRLCAVISGRCLCVRPRA
jgi:cellulose biosynthesis protein BcsQ